MPDTDTPAGPPPPGPDVPEQTEGWGNPVACGTVHAISLMEQLESWRTRATAAEAEAKETEAENESLVAVLATIEGQIEAHLAATGRTWRNSEVQFGDLARMLPGELERLRDRATAAEAECVRLKLDLSESRNEAERLARTLREIRDSPDGCFMTHKEEIRWYRLAAKIAMEPHS